MHPHTRISALPPGTRISRFCQAMIAAKGSARDAARICDERPWLNTPGVKLALEAIAQKELVDPLSSVGAGAALERFGITSDFAASLEDTSILFRMMPAMQQARFVTDFPIDTTAGISSAWLARGGAIPATALGFNTGALDRFDHATLVVLARELGQFSRPGAETVISTILRRELARALDTSFLDISSTAIAEQRPPSITSAGSDHTSTGSTAAQKQADFDTMVGLLGSWRAPHWVMRKSTASNLAATTNTSGAKQFPNVTISGGTLMGLPVETAEHIPQIIGLIDFGDILLADGELDINRAEHASVEMNTIPTEGGSPAEQTELVSFWQRNLIGLRIVKTISWALAHSSSSVVMAVSY